MINFKVIQVSNKRNINLSNIYAILAILTYIKVVQEFQKNIVGNFPSKSLTKTISKTI